MKLNKTTAEIINLSKAAWRFILITQALGLVCLYCIAASSPDVSIPEVGITTADLTWAKVISFVIAIIYGWKTFEPYFNKNREQAVQLQNEADLNKFNSQIGMIQDRLNQDRSSQVKIAESLTIQADSVNRLVHIIEEQRVVNIGMDKDIDSVLDIVKEQNARLIKIADDVHTTKGFAVDIFKQVTENKN